MIFVHISHTEYWWKWPYDSYVDIKFQVWTEEYLDKDTNLETEIILGEPSQLYFPSLIVYLYVFTIIDLLGEIRKFPYENTHLSTLRADFLWSKYITYSIHCFSFFSENIESRIRNKVIFIIYIFLCGLKAKLWF